MLTDTKIQAIKPPATGQAEHPDHKVTGLRLRCGAGGKKSWIMRRRVGAKVINRKLGNYPAMSLANARKAAYELLEAIERDGNTETLDLTFGTIADRWIDNVAMKKNASWRDQKRRLEMHVYPHFGGRKIADIRRADVRALIDGIEGVVLPNRVLATIRPVFRYALEKDWLEASPAEGVNKPNAETARDRFLEMAEIKQLWHAANLFGYPFGQFVQMLLLTGQRRSEVAGMRWKDINLDEGTWTLSAEETKAGRAQLVPLSDAALTILEMSPRIGPYVFTTDGETHIANFGKNKTKLDMFIAAAGEPLDKWRLHDLRRSCATHMIRLGVSEEVVARVLNHARQGVTARVYTLHSYAPEKCKALQKWSAEIMRAVEGRTSDKVVKLRAAE